MTATILSIGDELLIGQVVNTNASWLGTQLTDLGIRVRSILAIGDDRGTIRREIERAASIDEVVIVSGGLGPTHDDVTREAICDLLGCDLHTDLEQLRRIERRFADRGIELNERSIRQAAVPSACRTLPNEYGSAPGLAFTIGATRVYVLPGVPTELKGIFTDRIAPELRREDASTDRMTILVFGPTESALADRLADLNALLADDLTLAYLPSPGGIRLRAMRHTESARERYEKLIEGIRSGAGEWIVTERDEPLHVALGRLLTQRKLTLATAESCTGGMIGEMLTETSGSSVYYLGGVISYANSAKREMLGVSEEDLTNHGAVSREVAEAMARGARERFGSDLAVSVTGIAGPTGGSPEKPVGTVWIAVADADGVSAKRMQFGNERTITRLRAANVALDMVRRRALRATAGTDEPS